jgi:hypothetical protein
VFHDSGKITVNCNFVTRRVKRKGSLVAYYNTTPSAQLRHRQIDKPDDIFFVAESGGCLLHSSSPRICTRCPGVFVPRKAQAGKQPTKPVRLHQDVAELLEQLAPLFGKSVPNFASALLRPVLQDRLQEAAKLLLQKQKQRK